MGRRKSTHHYWGDAGVDWDGINNAADFIADYCKKHGRLGGQSKEKFGQCRYYAQFGLRSLHEIVYPGYYRNMWHIPPEMEKVYTETGFWSSSYALKRVLWHLDRYSGFVLDHKWVQELIINYQFKVYEQAYRAAVLKWPHLKGEILGGADYWDHLEHLWMECYTWAGEVVY